MNERLKSLQIVANLVCKYSFSGLKTDVVHFWLFTRCKTFSGENHMANIN